MSTMVPAEKQGHRSLIPDRQSLIPNPQSLTPLLLLWGLVACCQMAEGATGNVHRTAGYGVRLDVDARWFEGPGYRPVRFAITPTAPLPADRTLRLEFVVARHPWQQQDDLCVYQDIDLPAGTGPMTPIELTLAAPEYATWHSYRVNVLEDGQRLDRLCVGWTQVGNFPRFGGGSDGVETLPAMLVVADKLPDTSGLAGELPVEGYQQSRPRAAPANPAAPSEPPQLPTAEAFPPSELPQRWIDYTSLDVICLSLEQLRKVQQSNPAALKAVLAWTAAGGNLWVFGVGDDWQRLGPLEGLVGALNSPLPLGEGPGMRAGSGGARASKGDSPSFAAKTAATESLVDASQKLGQSPTATPIGWSEPDKKLFDKRLDIPGVDAQAADEPSPKATASPCPERPPFLLRPLGMGQLVAIAAENPFGQKDAGWTKAEWRWLLNAVGYGRWLWSRRHGMSFSSENSEFWNFLIPGVGLAPVMQFCVLITLFALAIGPVNYWLLRRRKRLHLLVVTTPLGAAALTLLLFGYALVVDGLGTRVRARSVTEIDQRRGQAVCWARLSYYAGLTPWRGLSFPADVAVFPLEQTPMDIYSGNVLQRVLVWGDDQRLATGWLTSRTPTQLITVRSHPTKRGLQWLEPADAAAPPRVANRLGTRIDCLMVRTADKRCYWAAAVEPDATASLEPIEADEARRRLDRLAQEHRPDYPPGITQASAGSIGWSRNRYYFGRGSGAESPTQASGRLEQSLATWGDLFTVGRGDGGPAGYVAIVPDSPEVVLAAAGAREEASFHVIVGRW